MNQTTFIDPSSTAPVAGAGNVGNGTMSTPVVSSASLTENFTVTCTVPGGANVGQFSVVGSVSGNIGTATSNVEFIDANKKIRFTITAGATPWAVNDQFTFSTTAGTAINKANVDAYSSPIAAKNEANVFTVAQRIDAGLGINTTPPGTGDFAISGSMTGGLVPLLRIGATGSVTVTSVASATTVTQSINPGFGDVDFILTAQIIPSTSFSSRAGTSFCCKNASSLMSAFCVMADGQVFGASVGGNPASQGLLVGRNTDGGAVDLTFHWVAVGR